MSPKPPFPDVIDSSWLSDFKSCPTKFMYAAVRRIKPPGESIHLIAGDAFAKGLEFARKAFDAGRTVDEAKAIGLGVLFKTYKVIPLKPSESKTLDRVAAAYESYLDRWPLDTDPVRPISIGGKTAIEFTFAFPLPISNPSTGQPMLFAGRCDFIGSHMGAPWCVDDKTTKAFRDTWANDWQLRSQFAAYSYAARLYGINVAGVIARGTAIQKEQIKHLEAFVPTQVWKLERWYGQTLKDITRAIEMWRAWDWDVNLDESCTSWSGCPYSKLCQAQDPEPWIKIEYQQSDWSPLRASTVGGKPLEVEAA